MWDLNKMYKIRRKNNARNYMAGILYIIIFQDLG